MCLQEYHGLILQKQTYIHDFNVCTKDYLMLIQCAVFTTKEKPNSRRRADTLIPNTSESFCMDSFQIYIFTIDTENVIIIQNKKIFPKCCIFILVIVISSTKLY